MPKATGIEFHVTVWSSLPSVKNRPYEFERFANQTDPSNPQPQPQVILVKTLLSAALRGLLASVLISTALAAPPPGAAAPAVAKPAVNAPVTLTDNGDTWTMDNGIVKATVNKKNGSLLQVNYHGIETLRPSISAGADTLHTPPTPAGSPIPSWEQMPSGTVTASVTIAPAKNGGERAEVAVKGANTGRLDIELRYTMERGLSGIYAYAEFSHPASYPAAHVGEGQFILQLDPSFDWFSVDADRNLLLPTMQDLRAGVEIHAKEQHILNTGIFKNSVDHKYSYCGIMYRLPAWGFSSTKSHIGVYLINPTTEYIGGGAEKMDLIGPFAWGSNNTIQDYWTSGHYAGGAGCNVPAGENWKRVIGPIFVYFNALENPKDPTKAELDTLAATAGNPTVPATWHDNAFALWNDALAKAKEVKAAWPYDWVSGVDYPHKNERGNLTGQFVLNDPQAATAKLPGLTVGLAHPDYTTTAGGFTQRSGNGNVIKWPHDGNYYQFWADGAEDGKFTIPNIRPGVYTLHAFADGVLGEFAKTDITVEAGKNLDLGKMEWKPVRYGRQVWEIGYPNRNGSEFFKGNDYWLWGWCVRYPLLFPNDITYTVGKSDYHKDWFFEQVPHGESTAWLNPEAKDPANQRFGWVKAGTAGQDMWRTIGRGRAATWTIKFNLDKAAQGQATLRIALGGADGGGLAIGVNGKAVGSIRPVATNALRYNTDRGVWHEYSQAFDAALLKAGENEMTLTVPAGELTSGVCYDYLRLELNGN
jgi:rhamnogalacturonan endolyase